MKIAVISNDAFGLLNFRGPLLLELRRRGHDVLALAPDIDDATHAALSNMGVQPIEYGLSRTGLNPIKDIATVLQLIGLLQKHRPDISLACFIKPVIYGTLAAWLAGVPRRYAMIEGLGFSFTDSPKSTWKNTAIRSAISLLFKFSLSKANRVIVLNDDDRIELLRRNIVAPNTISILGGIGVDLHEWEYSPPPLSPITFILVARLLWDKGIGEYAQASSILRKTHPNVRILLVGGLDKNPAAVPREVVDGWVSGNILDAWPGHVPVLPWLEKSSVFVLPSYREGVPRSTQEAMAIGRPVITTNSPGCRDTVVDGVNGFLVPTGDPVALADAMRHFVDHPEDIISMGRESRKLAEERFDAQLQNGKLLAIMGLAEITA
nr:glycosyltransferase family 4 protein [Brevundimonas naejangsanensis]